ncbi:MAG: FIST C-terminal domain-containing protein [Synergistaceae bacterium]|jgi:hypothetical protein|nr:FIST C-terminal domain-containing protein [Synergistaceae bacterium]
MIKTLIAHTAEMDDPESAVAEILGQLELEKCLLKNSVGIMACYLDFMKNEVVRAICERLPFDVVGVNTLGSAVSEAGGQLLLTLAVLTSDDVFFSAGVSEPLSRNYEEPLADLYNKASSKLPDKPALMLTFAPLTHEPSQDHFLRCLEAVSSGKVPIFGLVAADYSTSHENPLVLFNGETYGKSFAMLLISGNINPRFTFSGISEKRVMQRKGVITSAEDNILKEINDVPAMQYMESLGFVKDGKFKGALTIPLVVDYNNGTPPFLRAILNPTPEGYLLLAGAVPENGILGVGVIDPDYILETAAELTREVRDYDFLLIGSCIARTFVLEWDNLTEMDRIRSRLAAAPFLFIYSYGEFCPVETGDGRLVNRFHNLTLVSCAF